MKQEKAGTGEGREEVGVGDCEWFEQECEFADRCNAPDHPSDYCPEFKAITSLMEQGHTHHCACRIQWGDGICECDCKCGTAGR